MTDQNCGSLFQGVQLLSSLWQLCAPPPGAILQVECKSWVYGAFHQLFAKAYRLLSYLLTRRCGVTVTPTVPKAEQLGQVSATHELMPPFLSPVKQIA